MQRERDTESGLLHFRARSYDPRTGRFLQVDSLLSERPFQHYLYAANNPVMNGDPFGLRVWTWREGVSGLSALLEGTKDPETLSLMLRLFEDQFEPWDIRDTAYEGILYILGKPKEVQPLFSRPDTFLDCVNWDWIREAKEIAESRR